MIDEQTKKRHRLNELVRMVEKHGLRDLAKERDLLVLKWPDYRFMSPYRATSVFARCYREQYQNFYRREIDAKRAKHVSGSNPARFEDPQEFTSLWTQRQRADERGLRYEDYISFCMDFRLSKTDKTNRSFKAPPIPRPNQLSPSSNSSAQQKAWQGKFEIFLKEHWRPQVLSHVRQLQQYRLEAYRGLPAQDAFRELMLNAAQWSKAPFKNIMRVLCVDRRQLPRDLFQQILKPDVYEMSSEHLDIDVQLDPPQDLEPVHLCAPDLWQSCFGVPGARDLSSPVCSSCPQSAECQVMADLTRRTLIKKHGTADPRKRRQNRDGAARTALCRARKKSREGFGASKAS